MKLDCTNTTPTASRHDLINNLAMNHRALCCPKLVPAFKFCFGSITGGFESSLVKISDLRPENTQPPSSNRRSAPGFSEPVAASFTFALTCSTASKTLSLVRIATVFRAFSLPSELLAKTIGVDQITLSTVPFTDSTHGISSSRKTSPSQNRDRPLVIDL